jgi:hypothetical protein
MILGLGMIIWSSYKALVVAQENTDSQQSRPGGKAAQSPAVRNPAVSRYVMVSYVGLTLFIVGAVGAIFAAFRVMTRRF